MFDPVYAGGVGRTTTREFNNPSTISLSRLCSPTTTHQIFIWHILLPKRNWQHGTSNYEEWGKALSKSDYLHREQYLASVPLTSDDGMTYWCLVDKKCPSNAREIYASCESLRKRAFISKQGKVEEVMIHSIGSVFCAPKNRGPTFPDPRFHPLLRHRQEILRKSRLAAVPQFPHSTSPHPQKIPKRSNPVWPRPLRSEDIPDLCTLDVRYIRQSARACPLRHQKPTLPSFPTHATVQWHHVREDLMSTAIFGHAPTIKGAISGTHPGSRVWAYWTRGYYGPIDKAASGNCLHILRLVIEDEINSEDNARKFEAVLRYAQMEATEWKMNDVQFWNPTPLVEQLIARSSLRAEHVRVEREEESVASLMWYGEGDGTVESVEWWGNEKYGWC
ncbi:hypothetical protein EYC84_000621 [Monilinia fructicola]|uniref:LYC1 C-terminal domain-containing protein n=1 Tax=Monilinia fructicola TaxID=38448 RepID=A0A5M9JTB1_MONFR|nr:hypothetical protein EYC84_000621 [Monilinia fructicola]